MVITLRGHDSRVVYGCGGPFLGRIADDRAVVEFLEVRSDYARRSFPSASRTCHVCNMGREGSLLLFSTLYRGYVS